LPCDSDDISRPPCTEALPSAVRCLMRAQSSPLKKRTKNGKEMPRQFLRKYSQQNY
jgi:hypothetical protein